MFVEAEGECRWEKFDGISPLLVDRFKNWTYLQVSPDHLMLEEHASFVFDLLKMLERNKNNMVSDQ